MAETTASYKGIYAMHKYWGKKPFDVISSFINTYTEEGDVVLDSFAGSGVTAIEAIRNNRKAIAFDINPIATMLTRVSLDAVSIKSLNLEFESIERDVKSKIQSLYEATCPHCGKASTVTHIVWENETPLEVWYECPTCRKKKIIRDATDIDVEMSNNPSVEPLWFPTDRMFANSRINVNEGQNVSGLFTKRALVALSILFDRVQKIEDPLIKDVFLITFTGTLSQASNLVFVIRRRSKKEPTETPRAEVGSWVIGYWLPDEHFEINAWNCFVNRYKRVIRGKEEVFELFENRVKYAESFEDLNNSEANALVCYADAQNMPLPNDSIDYVFIDPPHAKRIMYMEQSMMWNSWITKDFDIDYESEVILSDSKERSKDSNSYYLGLKRSIEEIYRVLKHEKHCSIAFNSLKDQDWLELLNIFIECGFSFKDVRPLEYSATSVVQDNRKNALKTDFVTTWAKDESANKEPLNKSTDGIVTAINEVLEESPMQSFEVINRLFVVSLNNGYLYAPSDILSALEENFNYKDGKWTV